MILDNYIERDRRRAKSEDHGLLSQVWAVSRRQPLGASTHRVVKTRIISALPPLKGIETTSCSSFQIMQEIRRRYEQQTSNPQKISEREQVSPCRECHKCFPNQTSLRLGFQLTKELQPPLLFNNSFIYEPNPVNVSPTILLNESHSQCPSEFTTTT